MRKLFSLHSTLILGRWWNIDCLTYELMDWVSGRKERINLSNEWILRTHSPTIKPFELGRRLTIHSSKHPSETTNSVTSFKPRALRKVCQVKMLFKPYLSPSCQLWQANLCDPTTGCGMGFERLTPRFLFQKFHGPWKTCSLGLIHSQVLKWISMFLLGICQWEYGWGLKINVSHAKSEGLLDSLRNNSSTKGLFQKSVDGKCSTQISSPHLVFQRSLVHFPIPSAHWFP